MKSKNLNFNKKHVNSMKLQEALDIHLKPDILNNLIYFLLDDDNIVVYVGKTTAGLSRIYAHMCEGKKEFSSYAYINIPDATMLDGVESYYIAKYNPKYNIKPGLYNDAVLYVSYTLETPAFLDSSNMEIIFSINSKDIFTVEEYLNNYVFK